ncbi:hypothetical protein HN592_03505 [Candidatus Woesearchaeota archaeon]|nr:hypothetical protein [Candidatus Woesearchaeota archaeon]MBT4368278.1 hypothetical protein [Candidatus Woesearchaeota archaeon]MBT4712767.1 hypothetical protein [Candidatus Woesearchaeota archaeon]MBT6639679.1 hypothetical protein [Candidatus Woesearchaeota archaeon]MBT7133851.1 hypothetical protein [Candidatus Woesearchaeota archaeon]
MKISFFPLDVLYKVLDDKPVIHLIGKTDKGEKVCLIDRTFQPYFYAEVDNIEVTDKISKLSFEEEGRTIKVVSVKQVKKNVLGQERALIKITCQLPRDIPKVRNAIKDATLNTFEYDIKFTQKYLLDKGITPLNRLEAEVKKVPFNLNIPCFEIQSLEGTDTPLTDLNVLAIDIETYNPLGKRFIPEEHPILMIALYSKKFKKVITWKPFKDNKDVEFVDGEASLLMRFQEIIKQLNPDIITGYYSDGFDFPYIKTRAKHHKIKLKLGVDGSELTVRDEKANIWGIPHIDIIKFIRRVMGRTLDTDSFSLDDVASEILNEKKHDVDLDNLAEVWDNDPEKLSTFAKYNLQDAKLTFKLMETIFPNIVEMVKITNLTPYEVNQKGFSQLVEAFIIKQTKNFNELILNKPGHNEVMGRQTTRFQGAFVFEPKPGLYDDIVIFDFRSLYPTIITSHNISPGALNCECCKDKANQNPDNKDIWFCTNKPGFISQILEELVRRRMRIKELLKQNPEDVLLKARVGTLKLLSNSFYGYLGFFGARWYCLECAETVTSLGRHYIKKVIDEASNNGFQIIYSDTDSIFITLDGKPKESALKLVDNINTELPELMELEYEGHYPRGIFVSAKQGAYGAKKRYALLNEKNKLKVTGFEAVRRNVSPIAKQTQEAVLRIVLEKKDKDKALNYVKDVLDDLKEKKIKNEDVIIHTRLSKELDEYDAIGPHVAVAKRMKSKGVDVGAGTRVSYVITEVAGIIRDKARLPEELKQGEYDAEYYINNQVIPAVEKIFEVLGFKKEDITSDHKQENLNKFFK